MVRKKEIFGKHYGESAREMAQDLSFIRKHGKLERTDSF